MMRIVVGESERKVTYPQFVVALVHHGVWHECLSDSEVSGDVSWICIMCLSVWAVEYVYVYTYIQKSD